MRDDTVYLEHIAESIGLVEQYLAGADGALPEDLFHDDQRTQDAVMRRLETLADAARRLVRVHAALPRTPSPNA